MRFLIKALLAATALLPVTTVASAQDGRGGRRERVDGAPARGGDVRPDRQPGGQRDWARGERPGRDVAQGGWNGRPDRPANADRDVTRSDPRPGGADRWNGGRADRPAPVAAVPRATLEGRGIDRQGSPDWNRPRIDPGRGDGRPGDRGDWRNGQDRDSRRGWDGRRDATPQRAVGQRDDRRFDDRGWNRDWRDDGRNGQRYDRGNWNRTWRNDSRYDWTRYRTGNRGAYRLPRYYAPYGWNGGYRRFSVGVTLSSVLWGQNYWIGDPYAYRLPDAYGPYRWVRYYNDALLVDTRYGEVVDVVHDIFW